MSHQRDRGRLTPGTAGSSTSIGQIAGFRAGWGLGNALFIATSRAVIVGSASGGMEGGIMDARACLPGDERPRWDVHISVEDTGQALALAASLGGTVTRPAAGPPFGRLAAPPTRWAPGSASSAASRAERPLTRPVP